jgi:hypothetical protein
MPDITMCKGRGCILRTRCYRCIATPDEYQSYFIDEPTTDGHMCAYYLPTYEEKEDANDDC